MSETPLLWLIPGLPLLGAVVSGFFGPRLMRERSHWPVVLGFAGACAVALWVLSQLIGLPHDVVHRIAAPSVTWFSAGSLSVHYSIVVDPLTAVMLTAITFIGTWISVFTIGYLHGDPGYPRFFAVLSLFVFSMCILVLADNLLLLYAGWEGVGLCSYLLIGFWFERPAAAAAARKAFLMTRIGDAGMILGIFLLWVSLGHKFDFDSLFAGAKTADPVLLNTACLLLFCGAVGKSAQFPLHTWLPDAMEGPTPASALIHAATMVTAGVYLVARCMPLYQFAPEAQATVGVIAIITALLAALIALTQHDLKRVMAYSTVSQLAFMFLGLASGRGELAILGIAAGIFHLFTHAFFKALLFLASGSVMHAMGNVIDMRRIGGLRRVLPITHATFLCGALALAAVPPFAGFWSKDDIVDTTWEASHLPNQHTFYMVLFALAMFTAFLTAFYTFRAYFRTFWGEVKIPEEAVSHGHGSHADSSRFGQRGGGTRSRPRGNGPHSWRKPTAGAGPSPRVAAGDDRAIDRASSWGGVRRCIVGPDTLDRRFPRATPAYRTFHPLENAEPNWALMAVSTVIALAGIGLAYFLYVRNPGRRLALPGITRLSITSRRIASTSTSSIRAS